MRRLTLIVAIALIVAACGGDDDDAATTLPTEPPDTSETTAAPASGTIVIAEIDFDGDRIVLQNAGDAPYDLTGHWICNRPAYQELPSEVIEPGGTIEVAASSVALDAASGELGVYTARAFDSADAMVRYVAWGAAGQGRQATAAEAGLWGADDFVDNGSAGITSTGANPVSSSDWTAG